MTKNEFNKLRIRKIERAVDFDTYQPTFKIFLKNGKIIYIFFEEAVNENFIDDIMKYIN